MKQFLERLDRLSDSVRVFSCLLLILFIGVFEFWVGPELSTAIFYFFPILLAGGHRREGFSYLVAILCALTWLFSDIASGQKYSSQLIALWNFIMRLTLFLIMAKTFILLRTNAAFFKNLANIDPLTGALNRRGFIAKTEEELNRYHRFLRQFSIAYIDLDNFKSVNDTSGHSEGDRLLKTVVKVMQENLRVTDHIARMGGDEFAILFIETSQEQAKEAFEKCHKALLKTMAAAGWKVTFSVGVITYHEFGISLDQLLDQADKWMYWVKSNGKNRVVYRQSDQSIVP
jgi:diguanylate cyclase (GGDEF)-like protein